MKKIINPWVKMSGYNCFGCCPDNPMGVKMSFYEVDDNQYGDILSVWQPTYNHQSWINTLHGGVQATLLDEVCGWVVFKKLRTSGVTAKMDIKYKQAVSTLNGPLLLKGRLKTDRHRIAVVEGEIWMPQTKLDITAENIEQQYVLCTTCECTYFSFPEDKAKEMGFVEASLDNEEVEIKQLLEQVLNDNKVVYRPLV